MNSKTIKESVRKQVGQIKLSKQQKNERKFVPNFRKQLPHGWTGEGKRGGESNP